jgi:hypothetical protein
MKKMSKDFQDLQDVEIVRIRISRISGFTGWERNEKLKIRVHLSSSAFSYINSLNVIFSYLPIQFVQLLLFLK